MKLLLLTLLSGVVVSAEKRAKVTLKDPQGQSNVGGNLTLTQEHGSCVMYRGIVTGLTPGQHGFHVHQLANITTSCVGAGSHFNPYNKNHGGPTDEDRHVGDLGNIEAGRDGTAHVDITDCLTSLDDGETSIKGRTIVVHSQADDLGKGGFSDSLTTGHAGDRLACGIIQLIHGQ